MFHYQQPVYNPVMKDRQFVGVFNGLILILHEIKNQAKSRACIFILIKNCCEQ